jgi:hypothetical protein
MTGAGEFRIHKVTHRHPHDWILPFADPVHGGTAGRDRQRLVVNSDLASPTGAFGGSRHVSIVAHTANPRGFRGADKGGTCPSTPIAG